MRQTEADANRWRTQTTIDSSGTRAPVGGWISSLSETMAEAVRRIVAATRTPMPTSDKTSGDDSTRSTAPLTAVSYGWSRRNFLTTTMVCSMTATLLDRAPARGAEPAGPGDGRALVPLRLKINGQNRDLSLDSRTTLLDALR